MRKHKTVAEIREILFQIESGMLTVKAAASVHKVTTSTIYNWIQKYTKIHLAPASPREENKSPKSSKSSELKISKDELECILVEFGNYLLSENRKESFYNSYLERLNKIHSADLANWKYYVSESSKVKLNPVIQYLEKECTYSK